MTVENYCFFAKRRFWIIQNVARCLWKDWCCWKAKHYCRYYVDKKPSKTDAFSHHLLLLFTEKLSSVHLLMACTSHRTRLVKM